MASSSGHFEELHSSDTETQTQDNNATKQVSADRPVVKALWSLLLQGADALRKATKLVRTKSRGENPPPQDSEQPAAENSCLARSESALKDPAGVERRGSVSVRSADERRCSHSWSVSLCAAPWVRSVSFAAVLVSSRNIFEKILEFVDNCAFADRPYLREHEDDALIHVKLAALRQAFELTLRDPDSKHFLDHTTRSLLAALLTLAGKSTEGFGLAWENLMAFAENPTNWPGIAEERREAGTVDVYDMLYESIVLKVLECSENIPDPLKPTLRTQWLSDSTKKTAVMFYAWSQIKKRRESSMRPGGLYSHLYELFDYIHPEVMWAAYGSPSNTKDFYFLLRDQVVCFIRAMFSLDTDVYRSPPALAELVQSPPALAGLVRSPPALAELVLSPPALAELVLSPPALAELVLSPPALAELVLSPPALAELVQSPPALAELVQSPPALAELVQSPPALALLVQSPPALAVLVLSAWRKRLCLLQRYLEDNHRLGPISPDCKTCRILEG